MNTYRITNIGEANATMVKELTEEQYEFLNNIFEELNDTGKPYTPYIIMDKNTALTLIGNLIEWLRQNRDLSETIVTDNELEALKYLYNTYHHYG